VELEITPEPSTAEREAIEAALAEDAHRDLPSPWADRLLPAPDGEPRYGLVARALKSFGALRA
jgi:hypothetical protein